MRQLIQVSLAAPMAGSVIVLIALLMTIIALRVFFGLRSRTWHGPVNV